MGNSITQWKKKTLPSSRFARVLSKLGGFVGGVLLITAAVGAIASGSTLKNAPDLWTMLGLGVVGLIVDMGSHWIALQIDKKLSAK